VKFRLTTVLILAQFCGAALLYAQPANKEHWVATWTTAQLLARDQPAPQAVGARGFNHQTIRMIVRASIGGRRLRVKLANAFGSASVAVGAAHIAIRAKESEIAPGTDRALSFNGKPSCVIGPGMVILSDPVDLNAPPLADLAVSLYFPGETGPPTSHAIGLHTTYISDGDLTGQAAITGGATTQQYYWLAGIDVLAPAGAALIVAFGDSITDGALSTPETNHAWPSLLAARLAARKDTAHFAVANMGIGGNRLLRDGTGVSALARFDRDVLSQSGVKWVVVLEGINDIGRIASMPAEAVTADEVIGAYQQIIERAHTHGIKVVGATLTPYEDAHYYSAGPGEAVREAVNQWICSSGAWDAVVDFEAATRDPANPKHIRPDFDPGDHLHPNDKGYQAMADAFDLGIFTGKRQAKR
jgi:lysophospholipase L1-like esterase